MFYNSVIYNGDLGGKLINTWVAYSATMKNSSSS